MQTRACMVHVNELLGGCWLALPEQVHTYIQWSWSRFKRSATSGHLPSTSNITRLYYPTVRNVSFPLYTVLSFSRALSFASSPHPPEVRYLAASRASRSVLSSSLNRLDLSSLLPFLGDSRPAEMFLFSPPAAESFPPPRKKGTKWLDCMMGLSILESSVRSVSRP